MATTFGQLVIRVNTKLRSGRADLTAQIGDAINDAVAFYQPEMLWFQEAKVTVPTVIGSAVLAVPADFNFDQSWLSFNYNLAPFALQKISNGAYDQLFSGVNAYPAYYTYDTGSVLIYPTPDRVYSVLVRYYKTYPAIATDGTGDAATNDFLTYATKLIESKALSYMWADEFGDADREGEYSQRADMELAKLRRTNNNKKKTGLLSNDGSSLTRDNYYNTYSWR